MDKHSSLSIVSYRVMPPRPKARSIITKVKRGIARSKFTPEEDSLILILKDQGLS